MRHGLFPLSPPLSPRGGATRRPHQPEQWSNPPLRRRLREQLVTALPPLPCPIDLPRLGAALGHLHPGHPRPEQLGATPVPRVGGGIRLGLGLGFTHARPVAPPLCVERAQVHARTPVVSFFTVSLHAGSSGLSTLSILTMPRRTASCWSKGSWVLSSKRAPSSFTWLSSAPPVFESSSAPRRSAPLRSA